MACYITTVTQAEKLKKNAQYFHEPCELVYGEALRNYVCDFTGELIEEGTQCAYVELYTQGRTMNPSIKKAAEEFIKVNPHNERPH